MGFKLPEPDIAAIMDFGGVKLSGGDKTAPKESPPNAQPQATPENGNQNGNQNGKAKADASGNIFDATWKLFGNFADGAMASAGLGGVASLTNAKPGAASETAEKPRPKTIDDYRTTMDKGLDSQIKGNRDNRAILDQMVKTGDAKKGDVRADLDGDRAKLLADLKERSGVYNTDIKGITDQLGSKPIKNPTADQKKLMDQRAALEKERDKYKDQQTALQRWDDRNKINQINEKLNAPNLDPQEKQALLKQKRGLATGLLSTVKHYEQFDPKWGDSIYGKDRSYTNMREAGCGPTALAGLLDFHDQEDPEGKASRGIKDYYNPRRAADYATHHGRVKGSGTDGSRMFRDLPMGFESFYGNDLGNLGGAKASLDNGVPVAMVGRGIRGQGANGQAVPSYGGHFMILSGVSEDGKNYNVTDGGRNNQRNIHSMSDKQLKQSAYGYWNVHR